MTADHGGSDRAVDTAGSAAWGYVLVLGAATGWATLGLFYSALARAYQMPPQTIAFFRALFGLVALLIALGSFRRDLLRVDRRDLPLFILQGVLGIAAFFTIYAHAIQSAGMSVAAVLMYTAPVWVTLYGWRFLGEGLDGVKVVALAGTLLGAGLVAQVYDPSRLRVGMAGVLLGLGSGICYACYSVFNKLAVRRHSPWTVLTLSFACGLPLLALTQRPADVWRVLRIPEAVLWLVAMTVGPTLGAGLLYAAGLTYLPASVASIVVAFEPVMASVLAFLVLGERLVPGQVVGAAAIIASIVLLGSRDWRNSRRR